MQLFFCVSLSFFFVPTCASGCFFFFSCLFVFLLFYAYVYMLLGEIPFEWVFTPYFYYLSGFFSQLSAKVRFSAAFLLLSELVTISLLFFFLVRFSFLS